MTISSPTMSRNAAAMRTMSFAGIFRSSRPRTSNSAAASAPRSTRTTGDSSEVAMSSAMAPESYNERDAIRSRRGNSVDRLAERRRLHRASHDPGECHDSEEVRNHLHELRRDELQRLQSDLHRLGGSEQDARDRHPLRVPLTEDDGDRKST